LRRRRLAAATGFAAFMGLTAMAIHATVEFNLQIPANAATLVVLLALTACWGPRGRSRGSRNADDAGAAVDREGPVAADGRSREI
jgi:hypothetical protein